MKISIYIAIAANGKISNQRNVPDWLSAEYGQGFEAICKKYKAVIMGKTTYNILAPDYLPLKTDGTTVVLTTNPHERSENSTVVFTQDGAGKIVEMLAAKGHTEAVIIGGTQTISEFIKAGAVTDIYFVMEPVIFGSGLPFLNDVDLELKLNLLEVTKLNKNTVQLHYEIQK
ncbi:dihydrofolate reductase family protein [Mucilaginibacter sp. L3T2-6]|uniref:dihydrofolate reductase family protein n=1 Tax=Mucilaginibacter sp. L3T2-6 TaxID=3062491 RepID=UPI00267704B2|nr:dihydrofolate reductase family protein [Mucilaginibacter sp. L3T2-6]MDO3641806.1 dihydrofolate reductase family protein [Mucilaginibacter sp. L3T2-6]MDV6214516.1 dihydrofolate reductase family protein [Mucilaginibacter sp. L3T2-6]